MSIGKIDNMSASPIPFYVRILITFMLAVNMTQCNSLTKVPEEAFSKTPIPENVVQEAGNVITNFESQWLSEKAHRDPTVQMELATGKYLEYFGYAGSNIQDEPFWLVTDSAKLESMEMMEHDPDRFKAEACVIKSLRKILPDGTLVENLPPPTSGLCGIYVFVKVENKWKLLGYLNTMDSRNYEHAPDWLKQIIGEVPQK